MNPNTSTIALVVLLGIWGQKPMEKDKTDHESLQGTWKVIYSETGGKGFKPINDQRIRFEKNTKIELSAGEVVTKSSFKLDLGKKPKRMEVTILENHLIPESKGTKLYSIYEFDGDHLKIAYPNSVFPTRLPTEFTTSERDGFSLRIYERAKP